MIWTVLVITLLYKAIDKCDGRLHLIHIVQTYYSQRISNPRTSHYKQYVLWKQYCYNDFKLFSPKSRGLNLVSRGLNLVIVYPINIIYLQTMLYFKYITLGINNWLYFSPPQPQSLRSQNPIPKAHPKIHAKCPIHRKIMKASNIWALLPSKIYEMPKNQNLYTRSHHTISKIIPRIYSISIHVNHLHRSRPLFPRSCHQWQ